jgi:hypothetical protein
MERRPSPSATLDTRRAHFAYVTGVVLLALSVSLLGKKEACAFEAFALAGAAFVLANLVASLRKALRFKFSPQPIPFLP